MLRSLRRKVVGSSSPGPSYSPLNADHARTHLTDLGMHPSHGEAETHPMLGSDGDAADLDDGYAYDLDAGRRDRSGVLKKLFSWRPQRRQPIFITTLWVTVVAAFIIVGAFWVYDSAFPSFASLTGLWDEPISLGDLIQSDDGTVVVDADPTHVLVPIRSALPASEQLLPPMDTRPPLDVLVHYYQTGSLSGDVSFPQPSVDLVYLYVNASSPFFSAAYDKSLAEAKLTLKKGKQRHWRDNGELRGSIRSGALALAGRVSRIHVVSAAFDFNQKKFPVELYEADEDMEGWRMGQIPDWLDWTNRSNINWHFHPEIFRLPRDDDGSLPAGIKDLNETKWQAESLPTFNSFQIESRLAWLSGLSEEFIYSNDDMFIVRELSHGDFHHPIYGSVFRLAPDLEVKPEVRESQRFDSGEWGGLHYASQLVSQRFPSRSRIYMNHLPKAMRRSLVHEASIMFARELSESATRPFRESRKGFADVEMAWLVTHLQIERWREALLWTWAVAKVGDLEGNWGPEARDELRKVLGLSKGAEKGQSTTASTLKDHRDTLKDFEYVSAQGSWEMPTATDLRHTSFDGHMAYAPYSEDEWRFKHQLEKKPKKGVKARPVPDPTCTFNVDECLPEGFWDDETISSADMFTHFAFKKPACGDCLIDTLVTASGSRGLKAFLPSKDKVFTPPSSRTPQMWDRAEPMLPLTGTWQEADFTLANNVRLGQDEWTRVHAQSDKKEGEVNLLDWSVKLLSRYAYVYSSSPSRFAMVHSTLELHNVIKQVKNSKDLALLCINDDQPDNYNTHVRVQFQKWMMEAFGQVSKFVQWEREGKEWDIND